MEHQSAYGRFKTPIKNFKRRQTYAPGLGLFAQINLIDLSAFESENDGYRWALTAVNCFSRYAFSVPIRGKFAKFTRPAVETFLDSYVKRFGREPEKIQSDDGGEFVNQNVFSLFQEKGITHYSTRLTGKKASLVERFNCELKKVMFRYFHKAEDHCWIDVLQDLTANIIQDLTAIPFEKPKYSVGDRVRLSEYSAPLLNPNKKTFRKGYLASFTEQIFVVTGVSHGSPPMYSLEFGEGNREGDVAKGRFYEQEMFPANDPQE